MIRTGVCGNITLEQSSHGYSIHWVLILGVVERTMVWRGCHWESNVSSELLPRWCASLPQENTQKALEYMASTMTPCKSADHKTLINVSVQLSIIYIHIELHYNSKKYNCLGACICWGLESKAKVRFWHCESELPTQPCLQSHHTIKHSSSNRIQSF